MIYTIDVGTNTLTKLFYSCSGDKALSARVHYNIKVTVYNALTAYIGWRVVQVLLRQDSIISCLIMSPPLCLLRGATGKSLSLSEGFSMEGVKDFSIFDTLTAKQWLSLAKLQRWLLKTDLFQWQGHSILKNWL